MNFPEILEKKAKVELLMNFMNGWIRLIGNWMKMEKKQWMPIMEFFLMERSEKGKCSMDDYVKILFHIEQINNDEIIFQL